jgi:hypothetical protein
MDFKVGDKVRRIDHNYKLLKVGDIATVVKLDDYENIFVTNDVIKEDKDGHSRVCSGAYGVLPRKLVLVTPLEELL